MCIIAILPIMAPVLAKASDAGSPLLAVGELSPRAFHSYFGLE